MRVTYNQTPPPVVEEEGGEVKVNKQLVQVSMLGFSGAERECVKLLRSQPSRYFLTKEKVKSENKTVGKLYCLSIN